MKVADRRGRAILSLLCAALFLLPVWSTVQAEEGVFVIATNGEMRHICIEHCLIITSSNWLLLDI